MYALFSIYNSNNVFALCTLYILGAKKALAWSVNRARKGDRILLCHVRNEERESQGFDPATISASFEQLHLKKMNKKLMTWDVIYLSRDRLMRVSDQLIAEARNVEASYLVVGRDGDSAVKRAKTMKTGTVSDRIANKSRLTTVVAA